jgi:hypothetical protein
MLFADSMFKTIFLWFRNVFFLKLKYLKKKLDGFDDVKNKILKIKKILF